MLYLKIAFAITLYSILIIKFPLGKYLHAFNMFG